MIERLSLISGQSIEVRLGRIRDHTRLETDGFGSCDSTIIQAFLAAAALGPFISAAGELSLRGYCC